MSDSQNNTNETSSTSGSVPPLLLEDENSNNNDGGNTLYKYRDFSNMPEEQDADDDSSNNNRNSLESSIRVQKFPVKLYAILAQKEFHDIITWMPHGRSWKVLKPNLFESMVMPLFFEYSNYHSFNRLVNAWSFRRISSGPDRGSYYHELFLRGKPHLQKYMRRLPKTHKKLPMKKEDEPDFYKMDKENSLPPLEDIPLSTPKMNMPMNNGMNNMNGLRGGQNMSFTPVQPGQGMQRPNGMGLPPRMFPEGVASHDNFDGQDNFLGRGQARSPINGMPGMRDPTNFKSMEFKPATMEMGAPMGSQMMSQMGGPQMGSNMMGSPMGGPQMMGSNQMGGHQMMGGQMGGPQMGSNMMGGPQMGSNMMGSQMMNPQMMGNQMGGNGMNSQMGSHMGNQMGGNSQQFHNLQRLRQMQQMQLFDRMNGPMPVGAGGDEGFGRMGSYPRC